jgi:predicted metalloprotease with PDZ domain
LFALLVAIRPGAAQSCPASTTRYDVRTDGSGVFTVEAHLAVPSRELTLRFSEAVGRPEGQAASVQELTAWAGDAPVAVSYQGRGVWGTSQPVTRIRYQLRGDHDAVRWTGGGRDEVGGRLDAGWYFAGNAFFLTDPSWPPCPIGLRFLLPDGWALLSPWPRVAGQLRATGPDALVDNAFALGPITLGHVDAGTMQLEYAIDARLPSAEARVRPLLATLPKVLAEFFGNTPADRYAVIVLAGDGMDGGAFLNSFTLQLPNPARDTDALVWSHALAHEMIHLWLGNHIHGAEPDATSWFTEGFTDYLAVKLMYQAGQLDESMLVQRLANLVRRVRLAPRLSPGVGLVEAGRAKSSHWERIYGGGATLALLLDAAEPAGFTAALRAMSRDAAQPLTQADILARLDAHTNGAASQAFRAVNDGISSGDLSRRLDAAGLEVTGYAPDEVYLRFRGGCLTRECVPAFLRRTTAPGQ